MVIVIFIVDTFLQPSMTGEEVLAISFGGLGEPPPCDLGIQRNR